MTFDARSKERLEALGRTLPKKLPPPEPPTAPGTADPRAGREGRGSGGGRRLPKAEAQRHALEREQDPAALFHALITASADGSVPPHLLDRLREVEGSRRPDASGSSAAASSQTSGSPSGASLRKAAANGTAAVSTPPARKEGKGVPPVGNRRGSRKTSRIAANEDQDLYTAFAQLLLEDNED